MITKQENFIRKLIREELSNLEKQKEIAHKLGISTMMSVDASQYKNQTNPLDNVFNDAMQFFKSETIISEIFGIGSYFFPRKKSPNDVDFVIKLNIPFEDISVYAFSDKLEKLKEKHPDKEGGSLINVFVLDSKNRKLNSVDLWFINHKNEDLETNIKQREKEIYWNKIKKL